jgi:preprotein translocase subunit YajC
MIKSAFYLLQAAPGGNSAIMQFVMLGGILVVFYFFMIRPQMKRQKDEKKFRENIKKGDKVVTIGGMHGKIASVEDDSVLLEVDENVKLRFEKAAIRSFASPQETIKK